MKRKKMTPIIFRRLFFVVVTICTIDGNAARIASLFFAWKTAVFPNILHNPSRRHNLTREFRQQR